MTTPRIRFDVITLFPEMIEAAARTGVIGRGLDAGLIAVHARQLRDYTGGSPHPIDDAPYGGGPGQVMRAEPIFAAVEDAESRSPDSRKILLTPQGRPLSQPIVRELSHESAIMMFCGRYEGVDERVRTLFDDEISLGDFVMSGGEIAALAVIDAVGRLVPGVLGSAESSQSESFTEALLEYPQYTRPETFRGMAVPPILLSGNHAAIATWRRDQALARTRKRRPDLLDPARPSKDDEEDNG
jgi:tRNA (guanine37-N1)-methyltransferase